MNKNGNVNFGNLKNVNFGNLKNVNFGTKSEKSLLTKFTVNELREYAMINGISSKDRSNKILSKDKLFQKIKNTLNAKRKELEEQYNVPFVHWNASDISTMKPYVFKRQFKQITTSDLLDALPEVDLPPSRRVGPQFSTVREIENPYQYVPGQRLPPGSKIIRKEEGMTKQQKTQIRREIKNQIDYLSDMLEKF
jgi:hypothetical protein